uniref:TF_AP-2 domain-containing protein n=1 Tax=Panagrellus redivivus TaxID=6233 RepID=A0A7E4UL15_PANRE
MASDTSSVSQDSPPPGCQGWLPSGITPQANDAPCSSAEAYQYFHEETYPVPSGDAPHYPSGSNTFSTTPHLSAFTPYKPGVNSGRSWLPVPPPRTANNLVYQCSQTQPGLGFSTSGSVGNYAPASGIISSTTQNAYNYRHQLPPGFGYQALPMRSFNDYNRPSSSSDPNGASSSQQVPINLPPLPPVPRVPRPMPTSTRPTAPFRPNPALPANRVLFTHVPGRLTVLGDSRKLPVTLAEIRRRLNLPECLNRSNLSALLRKAKNRDGGSRLTSQLQQFQIKLTQGRRKAVANTSFTSLLELEAMNLVKDFATTSDQYFPFASVAYETLLTLNSYEELHAKRIEVETAVPVVMNIASILRRDKSPVVNMPLQQTLLMHPESQREFTVFSLLTHGFGTPAHLVTMVTLLSTMKTILQMLNDPIAFCQRLKRPVPAWLDPQICQVPFQSYQPNTFCGILNDIDMCAGPSSSYSMLNPQKRPYHQMPPTIPAKIPAKPQQFGWSSSSSNCTNAKPTAIRQAVPVSSSNVHVDPWKYSTLDSDEASTVKRIMNILNANGNI